LEIPQSAGGGGRRKMRKTERVKGQTDHTPFKAEEFSSRKLIELVDQNQKRRDVDSDMLMAVVTELTQRRHFLRELRDRGLLAPRA
jgi:hypothetical protein